MAVRGGWHLALDSAGSTVPTSCRASLQASTGWIAVLPFTAMAPEHLLLVLLWFVFMPQPFGQTVNRWCKLLRTRLSAGRAVIGHIILLFFYTAINLNCGLLVNRLFFKQCFAAQGGRGFADLFKSLSTALTPCFGDKLASRPNGCSLATAEQFESTKQNAHI